jgi:hypothetical protein
MILNLIHRPDLGQCHSLYLFQQEEAHRLGLKVTLLVSPRTMKDIDAVNETKRFNREFGDEIGLWMFGLGDESLDQQVGGSDSPIWLHSKEDKRQIIAIALERFYKAFEREPATISAYHLDAACFELIRELCPPVKIAIAGCFEEGVKVFHGCNHSWYLFNEGMPWGPWYPSKTHSLRPALNEADWNGFVAVPHLCRDLVLSYEGRNDFFASHPANVQRGMANLGENHPYDFNLVDQYRLQEKCNDGFSYYQVHVGAGWLGYSANIQDPPEVSQKLYTELLEYLAELCHQGSVVDMYMSEFAVWFRKNIPLGQPVVNFAKEILYGSGKHYFWYLDPDFRVVIDANLAGSIGDLRPYIAQVAGFTGPDSPSLAIGSYPYIIHSQYRTGLSHHAFDGARTTLFVCHGDEIIDLASHRTKVTEIHRDSNGTNIKLAPIKLYFCDGLSVTIETSYDFPGNGHININRRIIDISDRSAELKIIEYFKGCYGTTEYPEDMHEIQLMVRGAQDKQINFTYRDQEIHTTEASSVFAVIPQINTVVRLEAAGEKAEIGYAEEGHLFNPYYTLKMQYPVQIGQEIHTCLVIQKNQ